MSLAITGAAIWDGLSEGISTAPCTLHIEADRIAAVVADGEVSRPEVPGPARRLDFPGATAIPGLIDAHVHLGLDPAIRTPSEQLSASLETRRAGMQRRAAEMLRAGITTARDLGGGDWLELELRDRILAGAVPGPRMLCAGQPVTSRGGHCHFWGGEAESRSEIAEVIRRQVDHGAEWIKVMATGGVITKGSATVEPQFDERTLAWLVAQAADHGRPVAAHCHGTVGIHHAIEAGVRTIEHCSFAGAGGFGSAFDPVLVDRMAAAPLWVSPTVNVGWARRIEQAGTETDFFRRMSHTHREVVRAGVSLIASTDAGIPGVEHHRLPEALGVLARYTGLAPVDVLRAATSESAKALGLGSETGALCVGLSADVLVLDGNPLEDLTALTRPLAVVARGQLVDAP